MRQYSNFKICEQIYFLRSYESRKVLENLKTDFNKNLAYTNFFSISLNSTNFRRTTTPHKKLWDFFHLLVSFPFTASKTELDHYHHKLNVQGTSRVVKWPSKWRNFSKITNSSLEFFFLWKILWTIVWPTIDLKTHKKVVFNNVANHTTLSLR